MQLQLTKPNEEEILAAGAFSRLSADFHDEKMPLDSADEYLLRWYVSAGSLDARDVQAVTWQTPGPGIHTVIATLRPAFGGGLRVVVRDVNVR